MTSRSERALVIGCGGTLGFAWTAAMLAALDRHGWSPHAADVLIGTSAGAEAVAMLGAGMTTEAILSSQEAPGRFPPLPSLRLTAPGMVRAAFRREVDVVAGLAGALPVGRGNAAWLRDLGDTLAPDGWVPHPATWIIAADRTGRRVAFGSPEAPKARLGEAIAASWAVPGWFPPVEIGGERYLDGGAVSPTSADLLLHRGIDEVVVVAPMSSEGGAPARGVTRLERLLRRAMTRRLDAEVRALRAAGVHVVRIEPSQRDLDAMGANFMDHRRRERVLDTAWATAPALISRAFERKGASA